MASLCFLSNIRMQLFIYFLYLPLCAGIWGSDGFNHTIHIWCWDLGRWTSCHICPKFPTLRRRVSRCVPRCSCLLCPWTCGPHSHTHITAQDEGLRAALATPPPLLKTTGQSPPAAHISTLPPLCLRTLPQPAHLIPVSLPPSPARSWTDASIISARPLSLQVYGFSPLVHLLSDPQVWP